MKILLNMFVLISQVMVGDFSFTRVANVEVKSSWKTVFDTATIELPNLRRLLAEKIGGESGIKVGDPVLIQCGYNDELTAEFAGFVKYIEPNIPLRLECEDAAYVLRKNSYSKNFENVKLRTILQYLLDNRKVMQDVELSLAPGDGVEDIGVESLRLDKVNGVYVLEKLKEKLGIYIYFRGSVLYAGFAYTMELDVPTVDYEYGNNIIDADLKYRNKEDVSMGITVVGVKKGKKRERVFAGDKDGDQRTIHKYNVTDTKLLQRFADEELKRLKFDGYEGGITTFGRPFALHSYVANYRDPRFPERAGKYFIDEVVIRFGQDGYRREITFGLKVSGNTTS
jgi:hypothetical protein